MVMVSPILTFVVGFLLPVMRVVEVNKAADIPLKPVDGLPTVVYW
jgi:hypothetical protein